MRSAVLDPPVAPPPSGMRHEARLGGIRRTVARPTLEEVDRRRSQLWTIAFAGLVCLAAGLAVLASDSGADLGIAGTAAFRIGTVVLTLALAAYVVEKEHHLRRLARMLIGERVAAAALSDRLKELEAFHAAGTATNSVLVIEEVLRVILTSAVELLAPIGGSIMLLDDARSLTVVCALGPTPGATRAELGEGLVGRVALHREPILVTGRAPDGRAVPTEAAVCVPLLHRDQLLGVLEVHGATAGEFTEVDVQSLSLFADHAAVAIANSRLTAALAR